MLYDKLVHADPPVLFDTACVMGGGIAGLLASRVLSDRARRVVVIEPDDLAEFREVCTKLPLVLATATAGDVIGDVVTYHQAESRRRDFATAPRLPGTRWRHSTRSTAQGLSSAALHASCLASYLGDGPDLGSAAREFFALRQVVVDAAWAVSAGGDAARLDAQNGTEVPDVSCLLRHPATLADPALLARAVAANSF